MPSPFSVNIGHKTRQPRRIREMQRFRNNERNEHSAKDAARVWQEYIKEYQEAVLEEENKLIQERLDLQKKESSVFSSVRQIGEWLQSAFNREKEVEAKHERLIEKSVAVEVAGEQLNVLDELSEEFFAEGEKRYETGQTILPEQYAVAEVLVEEESSPFLEEEAMTINQTLIADSSETVVNDSAVLENIIAEQPTVPVYRETIVPLTNTDDDFSMPMPVATAEQETVLVHRQPMTIAAARQDIINELQEIATGSISREHNVIAFDERVSEMIDMLPIQIDALRKTRGAINDIEAYIENIRTEIEDSGDTILTASETGPVDTRHQQWNAMNTLQHYKARIASIQRSIERRPVQVLIEQWALPAMAEAIEGLRREMNIILVSEGDPRFAVEASTAQYIADQLDILAGTFQSYEAFGISLDEEATEFIDTSSETVTEEIAGRTEEIKLQRNRTLEYTREQRSEMMQKILDVINIKDSAKRARAARLLNGEHIQLKKNQWYTISGYIASGGMGAVFEVTDKDGNTFAMKIGRTYTNDTLNDPSKKSYIARSQLREMATLKKLNPTNDASSPFIRYETAHHMRRTVTTAEGEAVTEIMPVTVMERIKGTTLLQQLHDGLSGKEALSLITDVFGAVQQMHDAGISHRDLKPSNIMVVDGHAKIIDLGTANIVAKDKAQRALHNIETTNSAVHPSYWMEQETIIVGTYSYIPPFEIDSRYTRRIQQAFEQRDTEVIEGFLENTGRRRDLYALGLLLRRCKKSLPGSYSAAVDYVAKRLIVENTYPDPVDNLMTAQEAMQVLQDPSQIDQNRYAQVVAQFNEARAYKERIDNATLTASRKNKKVSAKSSKKAQAA